MLNTIETSQLSAAQAGDEEAFGRLAEPYRTELRVHCYRMLGSLHDAEDLVQETFLRAWRRLDSFQRHVSFRAWLYKIATNACLDALDKRPKRVLPAGAYPAADPRGLFAPPLAEPIWLEPFPDEFLGEAAAGPEARYAAHENITLAFLTALQTLPPRQRAALIMRDVLDFSANEAAETLAQTVPAVNSALHRARVSLAQRAQANGSQAGAAQPADDDVRAQLNQYVRAWETADVETLIGLLKEAATLAMPPSPSWYAGREAIRTFMAGWPFSGEGRGRWRLRATRANTQPAFELYRRGPAANDYQHVGLQVLTFEQGQIAGITLFLLPEFFAGFRGHLSRSG
jgi:RNA polymerase sigma-70 factor, ECF subfamily